MRVGEGGQSPATARPLPTAARREGAHGWRPATARSLLATYAFRPVGPPPAKPQVAVRTLRTGALRSTAPSAKPEPSRAADHTLRPAGPQAKPALSQVPPAHSPRERRRLRRGQGNLTPLRHRFRQRPSRRRSPTMRSVPSRCRWQRPGALPALVNPRPSSGTRTGRTRRHRYPHPPGARKESSN
jgi:hypothetical protein